MQYNLAVRAVDKLTAVNGTQYTIGSPTNDLCKSCILVLKLYET